jgi:hypothetical protein
MNWRAALLAFGLLMSLAVPEGTPTDTKTIRKKPFQPWVKKGRIIDPGFAGTQSQDRLSALPWCG